MLGALLATRLCGTVDGVLAGKLSLSESEWESKLELEESRGLEVVELVLATMSWPSVPLV